MKEAMLLKLMGLSEENIQGIQFLINEFLKHQKEILYMLDNINVFISLMEILKQEKVKNGR